MTIEEALVESGDRVAARDAASQDETWLGIYRVGPDGAHLLAWERMEVRLRAEVTEQLRSRVRIGATYGSVPFVWAADAAGFTVWSLGRAECSGVSSELFLQDGVIPAETVLAVASFVGEEDLGHRGVQVLLQDGSRRVVVEERDPAAALDPTYNRDNLLIDGWWTTYLGRDMAAWIGVPFQDWTNEG